MREQFEKLPEIARHIHKFVFQDDLNCYRNKIKSSDIHLVTWVNGAWYAFQEQQKRIDVIENWINENKFHATDTWIEGEVISVDDLNNMMRGEHEAN